MEIVTKKFFYEKISFGRKKEKVESLLESLSIKIVTRKKQLFEIKFC